MRQARFPVDLTTDSQITIIDTSGSIAMALYTEVDERVGDIFFSNSDGLEYTLSLKFAHRYDNHRYDFYKPKGIAGVFFANQVSLLDFVSYRSVLVNFELFFLSFSFWNEKNIC